MSRDSRRAAFAAALKRARLDARLSQRQLAERVGVHYTAVSQWELGRRTASDEQTEALENALGLQAGQIGWIMGYAVPPPNRSAEAAIEGDFTIPESHRRALLAHLAEVRKIAVEAGPVEEDT